MKYLLEKLWKKRKQHRNVRTRINLGNKRRIAGSNRGIKKVRGIWNLREYGNEFVREN